MADLNQQGAATTAFAPPPPLWKHFTRENLDRLEQIKTEASKDESGRPNRNKEWTPSELRALDLPPELRFLVPPEIPKGQYTVFGEPQSVSSGDVVTSARAWLTSSFTAFDYAALTERTRH